MGERKGGSHLRTDGTANTNVDKPISVTHREERKEGRHSFEDEW